MPSASAGRPTAAAAHAAPPLEGQRPSVSAVNVGHSYIGRDGSAVRALDDVSFELADGQFGSFIGPSGCGKTTLLKVLGGLVPPTEGTAFFHGHGITGPDRDMGYMFQQATLLPWRNVVDNVLLPVEIRSGRAAARSALHRAESLLELTGIASFGGAHPHELSGGMAQRAAICRMLVTSPNMLLLDEPFGALDELTRELMNEVLQAVCLRERATVVMVTHSISEAVFLSDIIYVMSARPGRICKRIEVGLERPRTLEMMTEPAFSGLVRTVRRALDAGATDDDPGPKSRGDEDAESA